MLQLKKLLTMGVIAFSLSSCGADDGEEMGHSTPIDSTNMHGTAPATYGGDNPANYQDTVLANSNDTGTKISTGPDNTQTNR
jgi:hypothetical protein